MWKGERSKMFFYFNKVMIELLYKKTYLTLKNLILVFLAWLYLYYKNLKKVLPEKIISVLHQ
jgi:hypothetical protein